MTNPVFDSPREREFKPGFRLSVMDGLVLAAGIVGAIVAWPKSASLGFVILFVVGHFFLFCNVFRISRRLELLWGLFFVVLARFTAVDGYPTWAMTAGISLMGTVVIVGFALRQPSYHGVGWSRVNPQLKTWWESSG